MKIVALYKTWDGGEFVDASLASIYDHVDQIVMVHSEISWLGERGNTVRPLAIQWCNEHDKDGKVHHVDVETDSQEQQYEIGLRYIADHFPEIDAVLVVDADEVWEGQYLERMKAQASDTLAVAYRANMHTYLKTPFYRVDPPFGSPTVLLRDPQFLCTSPRGCRAPAVQLDDVWFHHYTYVRESRSLVARKIEQSLHADGGENVVPNWMTSVYDNLPFGSDLHGATRWRHVWKGIRKVWLDEVPPAMRTANLLHLWLPDKRMVFDGKLTDWVSLLDGEQNALYRLALGRGQAIDLGTYKGLSAVILGLACERVHTVDLYEDVIGSDSFADTANPRGYNVISAHSLAATKELCQRFGSHMTCEQNYTTTVGMNWNGPPVDVLFVDADHSYQGTRSNVLAWFRHMAPRGRIIFHDDNDLHPGVQQAIREFREWPRLRFFDPGEWWGSIAVCEVL